MTETAPAPSPTDPDRQLLEVASADVETGDFVQLDAGTWSNGHVLNTSYTIEGGTVTSIRLHLSTTRPVTYPNGRIMQVPTTLGPYAPDALLIVSRAVPLGILGEATVEGTGEGGEVSPA